MAALTEVFTDKGTPDWFDLAGMPSNLDPGEQPIGRIVHRAQNAITLSGATDTMAVSMFLELPKGYAYKVTKAELNLQAVSTTDISEWQGAAQLEYDADGDDVFFGVLWRTGYSASNGYTWLPSVTNLRVAHYASQSPIDQIWSGQDLTQITCRLNNVSSAATQATSLIYHFETLIFTIEQSRRPYIFRTQFSSP